MKTNYILLAGTALSIIVASCEDKSPYLGQDWQLSVDAHYLSIDKTSVQFGANDNLSQSLSISSKNTGWTLSGNDSWLTLSQTNGSENAQVNCNATENKSADDLRTCIMTLASTDASYAYSRAISFTQSTANPYINTETHELRFSREGGEKMIYIEANTTWKATCNADWVNLTQKNDGLSVTVEAYNNSQERKATITIEGKVSSTITIIQTGSNIDDSEATLRFGNRKSSQTCQINTNGKWTATINDNWIESIDPNNGEGPHEVAITVKDNDGEEERSGSITITVGDKKKTIKIIQDGKFFTVNSQEEGKIPSTGGKHTIAFTTSDNWSASSQNSWVNLSPQNGDKGDAKLTITFADNASFDERTDITTISFPSNPDLQSYLIYTTQAGRTLRVSTMNLDFGNKTGQKTFTVETDGTFSAVPTKDWVKCTVSGKTVTVSAEDNYSSDREATVKVYLTDVPKEQQDLHAVFVTVKQGAYLFDVDKEEILVDCSATTEHFTITTNNSWTAVCDKDWATLLDKSGNETKLISVTIKENTAAQERKGTITVTGQDGQKRTIAITQGPAGWVLKVQKDGEQITEWEPSIAGGTINVDIMSNDSWTIQSSASQWLTASPNSGSNDGQIELRCSANTGASRTGKITITGNTCGISKTIEVTQEGKSDITFEDFDDNPVPLD